MKRARPRISPDLSLVTVEDMVDDGELESASLNNETAINCNVAGLQMIDATVEDIQFTGSHFSRLVARDVSFRRCDLSSVSLDNGHLVRVEFINCRMTGVDLSAASIHDVLFQDCKMDNVRLGGSDLRRVTFDGCSLDGVDFTGVRCVEVER